jgi:hypothetical protein
LHAEAGLHHTLHDECHTARRREVPPDTAHGDRETLITPGQIAFLDSIFIEPYQIRLSWEYRSEEEFVVWVFADLHERELVAQYCLGGMEDAARLGTSIFSWPKISARIAGGIRA